MSLIGRLKHELREIEYDPLGFYKAGPVSSDNLQHWEGVIMGPENSAYFGGEFELRIQFPDSYPFSPPNVRMLTKIYHPEIDSQGNISCEILNNGWSPSYTINRVLLYLSYLIQAPNFESYIVPEIAYMYKSDPEMFLETARRWTRLYAMKNYYRMNLVKIYEVSRLI